MTADIHSIDDVQTAGVPLSEASRAVIMLHGRGSTAEDILSLADEFSDILGIAYLAPQATDDTWYPYSFMEPTERNEPHLTSALAVVDNLLEDIAKTPIPLQHVMILGFSQGACLTLEYAARNARRYGAIVGLSGALIGPNGTAREYAGSFEGTPVYLGCSDVDPHIPLHRVTEAKEVYTRMGAQVTTDIFQNAPHGVFEEEVGQIRYLLERMMESTGGL